MTVFEKVYEIVQRVPKGKVITYRGISRLLSGRLSAKWVGWAMKALPAEAKEGKQFSSANVPWHRVVNYQGKLSTGKSIERLDLQMSLLHSEGVVFDRERGSIDLSKYEWDGQEIMQFKKTKEKSMSRFLICFAIPIVLSLIAPPVISAKEIIGGGRVSSFSSKLQKPVSLRYLIWMPSGKRPKGGWPLVIFLHGSGERGNDLHQTLVHGWPEMASKGKSFPFILVAPQAPAHRDWDVDEIEGLRRRLLHKTHANPDRVILTGLSMGGIGSWNYAEAYPETLAALIPVCGYGDTDGAERITPLPVWAFHGADDKVVPTANDQRMVDELKKVGGNVRFTLYQNVGHDSWDKAYAEPELIPWLLEQKRPEHKKSNR